MEFDHRGGRGGYINPGGGSHSFSIFTHNFFHLRESIHAEITRVTAVANAFHNCSLSPNQQPLYKSLDSQNPILTPWLFSVAETYLYTHLIKSINPRIVPHTSFLCRPRIVPLPSTHRSSTVHTLFRGRPHIFPLLPTHHSSATHIPLSIFSQTLHSTPPQICRRPRRS